MSGKEETWAVEYSETQMAIHIEEAWVPRRPNRGDWKRVLQVRGTFREACDAADEWRRVNDKRNRPAEMMGFLLDNPRRKP